MKQFMSYPLKNVNSYSDTQKKWLFYILKTNGLYVLKTNGLNILKISGLYILITNGLYIPEISCVSMDPWIGGRVCWFTNTLGAYRPTTDSKGLLIHKHPGSSQTYNMQ